MKFYHLTIITRDFDASLKFYRDFVGLGVQRLEQEPGKPFVACLADGADDTLIEIVHYDSPFFAEARGVTVCFRTDDVRGMRDKAVQLGLNPSELRSPDEKTHYFYVYDPDRVSVEFKQIDD